MIEFEGEGSMWRISTTAASVIVAVHALPALATEKRDCLEAATHDLRIQACSALIERNPNDAAAHYARGIAFQFTGAIDRAIADFATAIELNPYHAAAYESRGRAYASKGDYTKAVADVTKASDLLQSSATEPKKVVAAPTPTKPVEELQAPASTATPAIPAAMTKTEEPAKVTKRAPHEIKTVAHPPLRKPEKSTTVAPVQKRTTSAEPKKPLQRKACLSQSQTLHPGPRGCRKMVLEIDRGFVAALRVTFIAAGANRWLWLASRSRG